MTKKIITFLMLVIISSNLPVTGYTGNRQDKLDESNAIVEFFKGTPFCLWLTRTDEDGYVIYNSNGKRSKSFLPFFNVFCPEESFLAIFFKNRWKTATARNTARLTSIAGIIAASGSDSGGGTDDPASIPDCGCGDVPE